MQRRTILWLNVLALFSAWLLAGCAGNLPSASANLSSPNLSPSLAAPSLPTLLFSEGEVWLKRKQWQTYHPVLSGVILQAGDKIRPADAARATILCRNLTAWAVLPGEVFQWPDDCPTPADPASAEEMGPILNALDATLPYVISPRRTALLTTTPTLEWNAVPGAITYTVQIRARGSGPIWQQKTIDTSLRYPGEPPLQRGLRYLIEVTTDNGRTSSDETIPDFALLDAPSAQQVAAAVQTINALALADSDKIFALAQLYQSYRLHAEAIALLTAQAAANPAAVHVHRALGDAYRDLELPLLAEAAYRQAIAAAGDVDLESGATAQRALGEIYIGLQRIDQAILALTTARSGYERLGDGAVVQAIDEQLATLQ